MFWGNLLGKETPAGKTVAFLSEEFVAVKDFVDAVKEKQARLSNSDSPEPDQQVALQSGLINNAEQVDDTSADDVVLQEEVIIIESSPTETVVIDKVTTRIEHKATDTARAESQQLALQQAAPPQPEQQAVNYRFDRLQNRKSSTGIAESERKNVSALKEGDKNTSEITDRYVDSNTLDKLSTDLTDVKASGAVEEKGADSNIATEAVVSEPKDDASLLGKTVSRVEDSDSKESFVPAEIEKQLDNVDTQGKVIDGSQNSDSIREDWITARKSFYQRNYKLSEQSYQNVIEKSDDNFDAYGELGNVYFNQGKNKQAASAYYEAAAILVRKGKVSRAKSLMGLLRHLDNSKAVGLQKLIDSQQS
jgi:tetratricopeptide (TPR) repeat protein